MHFIVSAQEVAFSKAVIETEPSPVYHSMAAVATRHIGGRRIIFLPSVYAQVRNKPLFLSAVSLLYRNT